MTSNNNEYEPFDLDDEPEFTVESLLAMSEEDFASAVTDDLQETKRGDSPFQDRKVIHRTLTALGDHMWKTEAVLADQAEDVNCTPERFAGTVRFRRHLLSTIDSVERRLPWVLKNAGGDALRRWKNFANDLADALEESSESSALDELIIPFASISARQWLEIRRVKDPSRVPVKEAA